MFTGIVQTQGQLLNLLPNDFGARLTVARGDLTTPVAHGDSICVSGVCLTAVEISDDTLSFDVIAETLAMTNLGDLIEGDTVNLEPALTLNQPLGGHFVQGHVDGVGDVVRVLDDPSEWRTTVKPPANLLGYIVPKGSITIDGVSLTIASVNDDATFDVALIPETLSRTTLGKTGIGQRVNLEADVLAKTVVNWLERTTGNGQPTDGQKVTMDVLRKAGFAG